MAPNFAYRETPAKVTDLSEQARNAQVIVPKANLFQRFVAAWNGWMGPGQPLQVAAPEGTVARQNNYPVQYNINVQPRAGSPVTFAQLHALAEWDLLRIIMERKKNQLISLAWDIRPVDETQESKFDAEKSGANAIQQQLRYPDVDHDWPTWLRGILDDLYVTDAVSVEPIYRPDGSLYSLQGVSGSTIQIKIDEQGRTPKPPNTAYQQIVQGIQAVNFTTDQLIYKPWNLRWGSLFGFSAVEQILITINIGLRRESRQLLEFTAGTMPENLLAMPDGWTPAQIKEYQEYFDSRYMNNLVRRATTTMVPAKTQAIAIKSDPLKNEFDEWLVRIACWAFGVSPSGFVRDTNKATADTARVTAIQDGMGSDMIYIKTLMDLILRKCFKRPDLQFVWANEDQIDPLEQAEVETMQIDRGIYSLDDIRAKHGQPPTGLGPIMMLSSGPVLVEDLVSGAYMEAQQARADAAAQAKAYGPPQDDKEEGTKTLKAQRLKRLGRKGL